VNHLVFGFVLNVFLQKKKKKKKVNYLYEDGGVLPDKDLASGLRVSARIASLLPQFSVKASL